MQFKLVEHIEDFKKLAQPWNDLVEHSENNYAFMRHEWFDCWIRHIGKAEALRIVTGWSDGQLVAVAPLQMTQEKIKGVPVSVTTFLSSGISPRCNFIVNEPLEAECLFRFIFEQRNPPLLIMNNLETDKQVSQQLLLYLSENRKNRFMVESGRRSPFLLTAGDWDSYMAGLSKSFRVHVTRIAKRLEKGPTVEVLKITDYARFSAIFGELIEVSARSWKANVGTDLQASTRQRTFYEDFTRLIADQGLFEVWVMKIDGVIAAFDYYLKSEHSLSLLRNDFDPTYKYYSPGNNLRIVLLKEMFQRDGVWEYDMGGEAYEYKMDWTSQVRQHLKITACSNNHYGQLLMFMKRSILPALRSSRSKSSVAEAEQSGAVEAQQVNMMPSRVTL